jgi:hypothetical protein
LGETANSKPESTVSLSKIFIKNPEVIVVIIGDKKHVLAINFENLGIRTAWQMSNAFLPTFINGLASNQTFAKSKRLGFKGKAPSLALLIQPNGVLISAGLEPVLPKPRA